jgi:hypothetical protein
MILPAYDPSCRRLFHSDRLTAEGHRIALEIWLRATGREREDTRAVVYRCKRCSGFHVRRKRITPAPVAGDPPLDFAETAETSWILGL